MKMELRWNVGEKEKNENEYNENLEVGLEFRKKKRNINWGGEVKIEQMKWLEKKCFD